MNEPKALTWGIVLGAGLMYLLDPRQGGARRARIRDTSRRAVHEVEDAAAVGMRDLAHRREGWRARLGGGARSRPLDDDVLVERVRTRLGHLSAHPHAIHVRAKGNGCVELKGPVLSEEVDRVLSGVARVRGVTEIDDDLIVHATADGVPGLQGVVARRGGRARFVPATKLVAGLGAAGFGLVSVLGGKPLGLVLSGATILSLARSVNAHGGRQRRLSHPQDAARTLGGGRLMQVGGRNRPPGQLTTMDAEMSQVAMP